ncbi:unnamed protein product [Spodoptera exigua]|uniref:Uncharacterized protein n=1 Tax=Spodoptera exigua TaxID=7107 RepID=A0A922SCY5_SPOEX|nr:hypothetical protein HF086_013234 [Spodoptera exigua]CAH0687770.1 unnamed protein product [Spodoptera exigua]
MELMSSLLFCALVVYLPQALGENRHTRRLKLANDVDIKFNNSMIINQMPMPKRILLNINGPPLVNMLSDLQMVFMDVKCKKCIDCMERAIKAFKAHYHVVEARPRADELYEEVLKNRYIFSNRNKRETPKIVETPQTTTTSKPKRSKTKKRATKSVTVTKYVDGDVYALKVKETNTQVSVDQNNVTHTTSCQIFSVKKSYPCDSPDSVAFLTTARRKLNKRMKKEKEANRIDPLTTTTTTDKPHFLAPAFRKRHVDNSQVPENVMPSIEELY